MFKRKTHWAILLTDGRIYPVLRIGNESLETIACAMLKLIGHNIDEYAMAIKIRKHDYKKLMEGYNAGKFVGLHAESGNDD